MPAKTIDDYHQLAQSKNLEFTGGQEPPNTLCPTFWTCKRCRRLIKKSYHSVKYDKNSCRCFSSLHLKERDYKQLASKLKLEWVGPHLPKNTKTYTSWKTSWGAKFVASYYELAYRIKSELQPFVVFE